MGNCKYKSKGKTQPVIVKYSAGLDYRFSEAELKFLTLLFGELCIRNNSKKSLEKSTFLLFAPVPGLLGERFFDVSDTDKDGYINFEQFINLVSVFSKSPVYDQLSTLFKFCNINKNDIITKSQFSQLFSAILNEVLINFQHTSEKNPNSYSIIDLATNPCSLTSMTDNLFKHSQHPSEIVDTIFQKFSGDGENMKKEEFFRFASTQNWVLSKIREWFRVDKWMDGLQMKIKFSDKFSFVNMNKICLAPAKVFAKGKWNKVYVYVKQVFLMVLGEGKEVQEVYFLEGCRFKVDREVLKIEYSTHIDERISFLFDSEEVCKGVKDALTEAGGVRLFEEFYRIGEKIGSGKFSKVHTCTKISTGEKFTVKIIKKSKLDRTEREMVRKEISILNHANSPGVIHLLETFNSRKSYKLITEYVKSTDLLKKITTEEVNELTVKKTIKKILQSLKYLHSIGVMHRDIKPENILVYTENNEIQIKIIDFGLSTFFTQGEVKNYKCGTLGYMAPEILFGRYTEKVDVWSVGIITFAYLTGKLPFFSDSKEEILHLTQNTDPEFDMEIWGKLSEEAIEFTKLLLNKNPEFRPDCENALMQSWINEKVL